MLILRVFEYQKIRVGEKLTFHRAGASIEQILERKYIDALWSLYDEKRYPFFSPTRHGIGFSHYVGVVKVLDLIIEILPKADQDHSGRGLDEERKWQQILIGMLRVCKKLNTPSVSQAPLRLRHNSILDLYIQQFLASVESLLHRGLIKRYRKDEVNANALKGRLLIHRHLKENMVHRERFFISKNTFDVDHLIHRILRKALAIIPQLTSNDHICSRYYQLKINFPDVGDILVDSTTFEKIVFDRKSEHYRDALMVAKLLLLNLRPDVSSGKENAIAILFNMNLLWQEYIYQKLLTAKDNTFKIHKEKTTGFWCHEGKSRMLKPDIIIERETPKGREVVVLDTKWKNIKEDIKNVSLEDLRQMFAYHHYYDAAYCYLLYPGTDNVKHGNFLADSFFTQGHLGSKACGLLTAQAWNQDPSTSYLDKEIGEKILSKLGLINRYQTAVNSSPE